MTLHVRSLTPRLHISLGILSSTTHCYATTCNVGGGVSEPYLAVTISHGRFNNMKRCASTRVLLRTWVIPVPSQGERWRLAEYFFFCAEIVASIDGYTRDQSRFRFVGSKRLPTIFATVLVSKSSVDVIHPVAMSYPILLICHHRYLGRTA